MWLASLGQLLLHHHVTAQINQRCSVLIPPENGQTSCQINSKGKEVCTISCNSGYHLEGSEGEHSCELGKWYPAVDEPKCIDSNAQDVGHHVQYSDQTEMDISTCQLWGGDIFKTFDGAMYRYPGKCNYKLFGDCATSAFSVNMDLSKNEIATVFGGQQVILRAENGTVNLYSGSLQLERTSIPSVINGLIVERMGDWTVLKSPDFVLRWDGADNVLVIPSKTLETRSCGLCGNFDGMSDNDFTTIEHGDSTSPIVFGNSWKMPSIDGSCKDASFEKFCEYQSVEDIEYYRSECKKLASNSFSKCHEIINVEPWIEMCVESLCAGGDFCESAAAYFRECSAQGVALDWRSENMCQKSCPAGQVYRECASSCPETCKAGAIECNDECVSGCVCSEGLVLHDGECIKKTSCPCFSRGIEYNSGDSIKDVCNTCTCGEGKWTCTEDSCDGICKSTGVNHFETFDGSFYDFVGECAYSLVEPIQTSEENIWAVYLRYHDCEQHVKKLCKKSIEVRVGESYFTFEGDFKTLHDGHLIEHFPIQANGVQVTMASTYIQRIDLTEVGISVFWNGKDRVYVHAQASLRNSIHGLCGSFNDRTDDDLKLPDGTVQTSAVEFGNAWKALSICQDEFDDSNDLHPCDTYLQLRSSATGSCEALMSPALSACHNVVAVESYYYRCTYDYCACAGVQMSMAGVCSAVEDYARSCAEAGVTVNWQQTVDKQCQPSCPGDMRYQQCGHNSATCESLSSTSLLLTDDSCAEGCYCPEGLFLDRDHLSCVAASDCTCAHAGKLYQPGATRAEGCQDCTCSNGTWTCETDEARCVDKTCPAGMEWTECVTGCEGTCANLHILDKHACESVECSPGCQCQKGYVRLGDECVAPSDCPCFRGGKSYSENEVIETSCEKCTCDSSGHFECEAKPCWKQCSVFGDPHFTTFDGKSYKFQGSCKYVFARSQTNSTDLSINIENVPCGSSGVTCTRNLDVTWHGETISIDRETYLDTLKLPENCTAWTSGAAHFLQCSDVFVLKWDDQTTVSLLMNPRLSGSVEGLCGNMNGNQNDDFKTPGNGLIETSASIFGDSWKIFGYCPEATEVADTCAQHPNRQNWAKKSCSVIKSSVFSSCHNVVPTKMFYDACVYDGCGCDSGGDCECTCTAIAAYASECARNGVVVDWRKPSLCPMQCGDCPLEYSACNDPCPKTCQNRHNFEEISQNCQAGSCAEGCACQDGKIWDQHAGDCVFEEDCTCGMFDGVVFMEGDLVPSAGNECENCFCTEGRLECIGSGCSTSSPVTTTTHASTTFTTTTDAVCCTKDDNEYVPGDIIKSVGCEVYKCSENCEIVLDKSECADVTTTKSTTTVVTKSPLCVTDSNEWTEWMNYNIPTLANDGDFENHHFLRRRFEYCGEEMISAVECRPAGASTYSGQMVTCNVDTGLTCFNDNQEIGICLDYEVRFFCRCGVETTTESPTVAPTTAPTTEAKTIVIATTTSVPTKPTTTVMPTKSTETSMPTKSTTTVTPTKSTSGWTKQTTSTQSSTEKTQTSTTVSVCDPLTPKSCEMGWSQWLKIDEVPLNCKYEICDAPTSVECRVWNKQVNKIAPCSLDVQTCAGCEDMYARFYCPCDTTEAPKPTTTPTKSLPTTTTMITSTSIPEVCEIDMEKKLTKQVFSSSSISLTDSRIGYSGWMAGKAASGEFVTLIFQEPQVITGLKLQRIMGNLYPTSIRIYVKGSESKSQADITIPEGEGLVFLDQPLIASEVSFLIMKWVGDMPSLKMSVLTSCDTLTTTSTQTTTTVCTKGCALTCGDLCQKTFVEYTNMGLCKSAETCLRPTKCIENTLTCDTSQRFDGQRCVNSRECACLADDGTVIKPGQAIEGKECDQVCVDNKIELSCDSIVTTTSPAVTTSHTRTTEGKTLASTVSVTEGPVTTTTSIGDKTETVTVTTVSPTTKTIEEKTTDLITGKVLTTRTTVPTESTAATVTVPISTDEFTTVPSDGTTVITDETTTVTVTTKPSGPTETPIIHVETTRKDGTTTTKQFTLTTTTSEDTTIQTVTPSIEDCKDDCDFVTQTIQTGATKTTQTRTSEGLITETTTTDVTEDGTAKTTTTTTMPNDDDTTTITTTTTSKIDDHTTEKLTSTTTTTTEGSTTTEHIETTTVIPPKTSLTTSKPATAPPSVTTSTTRTTEGTPVSSTVSVTDGPTTMTKTIDDQTETVTTTTVSPETTTIEEKTTNLITGTVSTKITTLPTTSSTGKVTVPISTDKFTTVPSTDGKTVIVDETTTITVTSKTTGATENPIIHVETKSTEGTTTTEAYTLTTKVSEDTTVQTLTTTTGDFVSQTTQTGASITTEMQTSEGIRTETTFTDVTENGTTEITKITLPNGDDTTIVTKTTTTSDGKTTEKLTTKTTKTSEGTSTTEHVETTTKIPSTTSSTSTNPTTTSSSVTTSTTRATDGTSLSTTISVTEGPTTITKTTEGQTETIKTTTASTDKTTTEEITTDLVTGETSTTVTVTPTNSVTETISVPISTDKFTLVSTTSETTIMTGQTKTTIIPKTTPDGTPVIHVETVTPGRPTTTEQYTVTTKVSEDTTTSTTTLTTSTGDIVTETTRSGTTETTKLQTTEGIRTETVTTEPERTMKTVTMPNGDFTSTTTTTTSSKIDDTTAETTTTTTTTAPDGTLTSEKIVTTTKTPYTPSKMTSSSSTKSTSSSTSASTTSRATTSPSYPTDSGPTTGACVDRIVNQMFTIGCDRCYCSDAGGLICKKISDCETTTRKSTISPHSTSSSSTASTTTTESLPTKSFTTTTTTPVETTITTIEIPESCLVWDNWQNNNFVSTGDDKETIEQYLENSNICAQVMDIQCRVANFLTPSDQTTDMTTCDIESGLTCTPSMSDDDFFGFGACLDYEIRLYCIDARKEECMKPDPFIVTETTVISTTASTDSTSTKSPVSTTKPLVVSTKTSERTTDGTMVTTFTEQPTIVSETFSTTGEFISKTTTTIIDDTITTSKTETPTTVSIKTTSSDGLTTRSTEEITSKSTGSTTTVITESTTEDATATIEVPVTEETTAQVPKTGKTTVSTPTSTSSIVTEPIDTTTTKVTIFSENTETTLIYSTKIDTTTGATIGTLTTEDGDIITETTEYFDTETSSVTETTRTVNPVTRRESTVSTTTLPSESTTTEAPTERSTLSTVSRITITNGDLTTEETKTTKVTEIPSRKTTIKSFTDGTVKTTTQFTDGTQETTTTTPSLTTSKVQTTDGQTISSTVSVTEGPTSRTTLVNCQGGSECQKKTGSTTLQTTTTIVNCEDTSECEMKTTTRTTVSPTTTTIEKTSMNPITGEVSTTSTIAPTESITETVSVPISTDKIVTVPISGKTVITDSTGTTSISTNPTAKVPTIHVETTTSAGSTTSKTFTLTTNVSENTTTKTLATVTGEIVTETTKSGTYETTKTLTSEGYVTETTTTEVTDDFTKTVTTTKLPNSDDTTVVTTTSTTTIDDKTTQEVKTQTTITPEGSTTSEYVTTTTTIPARTSSSTTKGNVTTMKSTTESEEITETTVFDETTSVKTTTTVKTTKTPEGTVETTTKTTTSSPDTSSTETVTEIITPDGHVETSTVSSTTTSLPDGTITEITTSKIHNDDDTESTTTTTTTRKTTPGKETATVIHSDGTTVITETTTSVPIPTDSSKTTTPPPPMTTSMPNDDDTVATSTTTTTKIPSTTTTPIIGVTTKHPVFTSTTVEPSSPSSTKHSSSEGPYSTTKSTPVVSTSSTVTESGSTISTETTVTDGSFTTTKLVTETSEEITTKSITESTVSTEKITTDLSTGKTIKTTTTAPISSTKSISVPITSSTVPDVTVPTEGITVVYTEDTTTTITATPSSSTEDIHVTVTTQKTTEGSTEEPSTEEYVFTTMSTDQSTTELLTTKTGALVTKMEKTASTVTLSTTSEAGTTVTETTTKITPTEEIITSTTTYPSGETETTTTSTTIMDETTAATMTTKTMGDLTTSTSYLTKTTPPTTLPTEVTQTGTSSTVTMKMPTTDMTSEMTSMIASTVSEHFTKTSQVSTSKSSQSSSTLYPEETTMTSENTPSTASPITHKETPTILVTGSYTETTTSGGITTSTSSSTISPDGTTVSTTTVTENTKSTTETSTTDGITSSTTETINLTTGETTVSSTTRPESTVETITIPYGETTLSVPTEGTVTMTTDDFTKTTSVTTKPVDKSTISIVITTDSTEGSKTTELTETTTITPTDVTKKVITSDGTVVYSSTLASTAGSTIETTTVSTSRGTETTETVTTKIPNGTTKISTTVSPTGEITKTETMTKSTSPTSSETTTTTTTPDKKTETSTTKTTAIPTRTSVVTTSPDGTVTSTVTEHTIVPITKVEVSTAPMLKTTSKIVQTTTMVPSTKPTFTTTTDEELTTLIQSTIATHMSTKSSQSTRSATTTTSPGGYCITDEGDIIPEGEQTIDNTECVTKSCDKYGEFLEMKVPAKECLISATGSVSTFDEFVYDSKSCTGISVTTCDSDDLTIQLVPSESILFELENLSISLDDTFKSLSVDGVDFDMTALDALNEVLFQKAGVRLLDLDEEFVILSPLIRISISSTVVKIRAEPDMFGKLCGGCGNADCNSNNDQVDDSASDEADGENCDAPICEQPMEDLDQICEYISDAKFSACITNSTAQFDFCRKSACECLSSGDSVESCRCKMIAAAMDTCQLQTDSCINWRSQYGCTMPECAGNKIWRDCGSTCVRTCAHILDEQESCEDEVFQPGCYCPPGTVFKGGQCVDERECKCTCKGWGDPHYQTFDKTYYAFQGNCSYVLAQDENKDFTVIGHNEYCLESPTNTCTKAVTLRYKGHEVTLVHGLSFIIDEVTKTVLEEDTILGGNIAVKLVRGRFILIEVEQISLKIMYDEMTRGFAISIPILVYHDKVGGLCGNCNLDGSDDFIDITGEEHFVPITFAETWKLEEITCDDEVYTTRPPTMSTPHNPNNCTAECEILMDDVFSSCRKVVDVSPFLSSCMYDACNNLPNASCYAIGAYADECRKSGICVNWREEKTECPFTCEDHLEYNHCANTCDKNECSSASSTNCEIVEECTCPEGFVLQNSECIKPEDCLVCLGEYKEGEKWRNSTDPCTEHICIDGLVEDKKETCHTEVRCVADGMVAVEILIEGECCSDYECQCDRSTCPEKPTCAEDEYLVVIPGLTCCDSYTCQPRSCSVATTVDFLQVEECVSLEKQNLTTCAGYCASTTELMETFNGTEKMKSCTCCSAVESTKKQVDLMCPGGVRVRYEHEEITLCSCNASQCSNEN